MTLLQAQNCKNKYDRKSRKTIEKTEIWKCYKKINNTFSNKYQYLKIMLIFNKVIFFISLLHILLKEVFLISIPILETITNFLLLVTYCESCMN